jgi:hypothetical protein
MSKASKTFFFGKKNQKTSVPGGCGGAVAPAPRSGSFFAAFFSKKEALTYA